MAIGDWFGKKKEIIQTKAQKWVNDKKESTFTFNEEKKEEHILKALGMSDTHALSPMEEQQLFADIQRNTGRSKVFEKNARTIIHTKTLVSTYLNRDLRALKGLLSEDLFPKKPGESAMQYLSNMGQKLAEVEASSHRYSQLVNMFSTLFIQELHFLEYELNIDTRYMAGTLPNSERVIVQQLREMVAMLQDVGRLSAGNLATLQGAKLSERAHQGLLDIIHLRNVIENYHTIAFKEELIAKKARAVLEHYKGEFNRVKSEKKTLLRIENEISNVTHVQRAGVRHGYYSFGNICTAVGLIGMFCALGSLLVSGLGLLGVAGAGVGVMSKVFNVGQVAFFNTYTSGAEYLTG